MSNRIHELLSRNLQEVFGEGARRTSSCGDRRRFTTPVVWRGCAVSGEKPDYTGLDVTVVRDGKIAALYVFLDSMPS